MRLLPLPSPISTFSLVFPLLSSVFLALPAQSAILAIDYGTEWMKASLISPGVPFDVLLNRDSKRKIPSVVAWKGGDRLRGGDVGGVVSELSIRVMLLF